jgi:hypothetical protein
MTREGRLDARALAVFWGWRRWARWDEREQSGRAPPDSDGAASRSSSVVASGLGMLIAIALDPWQNGASREDEHSDAGLRRQFGHGGTDPRRRTPSLDNG